MLVFDACNFGCCAIKKEPAKTIPVSVQEKSKDEYSKPTRKSSSKGKKTKDKEKSPKTKDDNSPTSQEKSPKDEPDAREQMAKVGAKDEQAFIQARELSSRVVARLHEHDKRAHDQDEVRHVHVPVKEKVSRSSKDAGLVLNFPLTFQDAEVLRCHYSKTCGKKPLSIAVAEELLDQLSFRWPTQWPGPVVEIPRYEKDLFVVGDLFGQLQDLLTIFHMHGPPASNRVYVFNGNIADKGPNGMECFLLIFAYFLADPTSVVINRGNHEDVLMNAQDVSKGGGFRKEVITKCGHAYMYKKFAEIFKLFPLCTVLKRKVLVIHGGISTKEEDEKWMLTLDFIRSLEHTKCTMPDLRSTEFKDVVFNNLLWSGPSEEQGWQKNKRGVGIRWGSDVTAKFLKENQPIQLIVRSSEVPKDAGGHSAAHDGRVCTVFSASNYNGTGNTGCVLEFAVETFPNFVPKEHAAMSLERIATSVEKANDDWCKEGELMRKEAQKKFEEQWWNEELSKLMVAIVENKPRIRDKFLQLSGGNPLVAQNDWEDCVAAGVGEEWHLDLAWKAWKLPTHGAEKRINFPDFLRRFNVVINQDQKMSFKFNAIDKVFDAVVGAHENVKDTLKRFDKTGSGHVDLAGMKEALSSFDLGITPAQLDSIIYIFFEGAEKVDGVPQIPVDEFLARFAIVHKQADDAISKGGQSEEERIEREAMSKIGHIIATTSLEDLEAALTAPDKSSTNGKKKKGKKSDADDGEAEQPASARKSTSKSKSKKKSKTEEALASATQVTHDVGPGFTIRVERVFELLDTDNSGFLETEEFIKGMKKIPGLMEISLSDGGTESDAHLKRLARMLNKDGQISLIEFLGAFCFEDNDGVGDALADHLLAELFRYRHIIEAGCRYFDHHDELHVTKDEFMEVLSALNAEVEESGMHFSQSQMEVLCDGIASEKGGMELVAYETFFESFEVVDSENLALGVKLEAETA